MMLELLRIERERKYKTSTADLPILIIICYYKAAYIPATSIYPMPSISQDTTLTLKMLLQHLKRDKRN